MNFKRTIGIILIFSLINLFVFTTAAQTNEKDKQLLQMINLGFIPQNAGADTFVTKEILAYSVAKLIENSNKSAVDTNFSDVKKDNPYSGYINFIQMFSMEEYGAEFYPKKEITLNEALDNFLFILGYSEISNNNVYLTASKFGLLKNVKPTEDKLKTSEFAGLLENVLEAKTAVSDYSQKGTSIKSNGEIFAKKLGLSKYNATILGINDQSYSALIEINSIYFQSNEYIKGEQKWLKSKVNLDLNNFNYCEVIIWTNSENEIVSIELASSNKVTYGYVYSVNLDTLENSYNSNYIKNIKIFDDNKNYKLASDADIYYNGELLINKPVTLRGKFAKFVFKNDEIKAIEAWDTKKGGIITEIKNGVMTYTAGDRKGVSFSKFSDFSKKLIYIYNQSIDLSELKEDTYFDYYIKDDLLVICGSQRTVVETLYSMGNEEAQIGNESYYVDKNGIYFSKDGKSYKKGNETEFYNCEVKAYLDANNRVCYVALIKEQVNAPFVGVLNGVKQAFGVKDEVRIINTDNNYKSEKYFISENVKLSEGLFLSEVYATKSNLEGKGVYRFYKNSKNEIYKIEKLKPIEGFGAAEATPTKFNNDSLPYLSVAGKTLYFDGAKIIGIYLKKGVFSVKEVGWNQLNNRNCDGAMLKFYAEEGSSDISLVVMSGDLTNVYSAEEFFGVVSNKNLVIDEDGDQLYKINIFSKKSSKDYLFPVSVAEDIPKNSFVVFRTGVLFDDYQIKLMGDIFDLTAPIKDWKTSDPGKDGIKRGIVKKIDNRRIYFEDGQILYMHPYDNQIFCVSESETRFKLGSISEIGIGSEITYSLYYNEIRVVFYE